jgi:TrkA domain protein
MPDVTETPLPGVGVRHDFTTASGERLGVVSHRGGRREIVVYDRADPDACTSVLHLDGDDTRTLAELLGASRVSEVLATVTQQLEGLTIDWVVVADTSGLAGATIADGEIRTRTGASIVAVVRDDETRPAPGPEFRFEAGDTAVVVGTPDGVAQARTLLT